MAASYQIWLLSKFGQRVADLTNVLISAQWARVRGDAGMVQAALPLTFDRRLIDIPDGRIEIWRRPADGYGPQLIEHGFIRLAEYDTNERGEIVYVLSGPGRNDLLARKCVWPVVSTFWLGSMTDHIDDIMRELVRRNLCGEDATPTYRNITTAQCGFTFAVEVDPATALGNTAGISTHEVAGRNLLALLQEMSEASKTLTTPGGTAVPIFYDIEIADNLWTFRCYLNQLGQDHSSDSGQPVCIGLEYGNLQIPVLTKDYTQEITYAYGCWAESGNGVVTASDTARAGVSPLNVREQFVGSRISATGDSLVATCEAAALLNEGKPKTKFTGRLESNPGSLYGVHWGFGDQVSVRYLDEVYDCHITTVQGVIDRNGREQLDVSVEVIP